MTNIIYPGIPKIINVTVLSGETTGNASHYMNTTPKCGRPNPNQADGISAYATATDTLVIVTCEVPVSQNTVFSVLVMV